MEQTQQIMEQPELVQNTQGATAQKEEFFGVENTDNGSIGKFKDSKALMQAYVNLQSEFTKKCQALSELKQKDDNKQNSLPLFDNEEWQQKVDEFFKINPQAQAYSQNISNLILGDKSISLSDNPLEVAWNKIIKENFKSPQTLIEDETFLNEYVFKNKNIKEKILNEYFNQINFETSPTLITKHLGSKSVLTPKQKPKSISEAGALAKSMFD